MLLNALTILSLLVFVAAMNLWVRSYSAAFSTSRFQHEAGRMTGWRVGAWRGLLFVRTFDFSADWSAFEDQFMAKIPGDPADLFSDSGAYPRAIAWTDVRRSPGSLANVLGFGFVEQRARYYSTSGPVTALSVSIPLWSIALPAGSFFAIRAGRGWRKWKRSRLGLCANCGYDLRATPDRCPECGAVSAANTSYART